MKDLSVITTPRQTGSDQCSAAKIQRDKQLSVAEREVKSLRSKVVLVFRHLLLTNWIRDTKQYLFMMFNTLLLLLNHNASTSGHLCDETN